MYQTRWQRFWDGVADVFTVIAQCIGVIFAFIIDCICSLDD